MGRLAYTTQTYITAASLAHGDIYDYSNTVYTKSKEKIEVICRTHGKFSVRADGHLNQKTGCPSCGRIKSDHNRCLTASEYVERASKLHNNFYNYSKTHYTKNGVSVTITCPVHGDFNLIAYDHIKKNALSGCQKCCKSGYSRKAITWIESIAAADGVFIQHAENIGEYKIPGTRFKADGFCQETNTVYEFYGDKWHGNLEKYAPQTLCHPFSKLTAQDLNNITMAREFAVRALGYNIVSRWES